jgi:hypothetical protein
MVGTAEKDHGTEVVRREVLLEETPHESPRAQDLLALHLVEGDHVQPSFALVVGLHVGLDRVGREERTIGTHARDIHEPERGDGLRLAVLENLEIVTGQVSDNAAARVSDGGIDFDRLDLTRKVGCCGAWATSAWAAHAHTRSAIPSRETMTSCSAGLAWAF